MNVFFDTEFTGLVPNTTLISIGMVAENGKQFYAEFTDYNRKLCIENVLRNRILNIPDQKAEPRHIGDIALIDAGIENKDEDMFVRGSSNYICKHLEEWFFEFCKEDERVQLVSDVCHYDMYLFCNLFGGVLNIPQYINPVCYDICQDIMTYYSDDTCGNYYNCEENTMRNAFDVSRETFLVKVLKKDLPKGSKHNSLYDAWVIKGIYDGLRS